MKGPSLISTVKSESSRGFTFVEVLASMAFMAIVIPVAIHGMTVANRAGVVAERKGIAATLASNLLTELILTEEWNNSEDKGDFGDEWPGYRWEMEVSDWEEESMREVSVHVFFTVQGIEYGATMTTLAEPISSTTLFSDEGGAE